MGKLRVLSAREVCRILEDNGFLQVRQRGSHMIMQMHKPKTQQLQFLSPITKNYASVLCDLYIRQSGLPRVLFEVT